MKRVGIIGGMGPLASADLYLKIIQATHANSDQENIPLIIDNFPQIEDRTAFILGSGENPVTKLIESATRLKKADCQAFAMACNTAHYFSQEVVNAVDLPIIHIAEVTVKHILQQHQSARKVAVLATTGTKKARIYDQPLEQVGLISVPLSEDIQMTLMDCIYKGVKAGKIEDYVNIFETLVNQIEADIFIAGCTEIPLFLPLIQSDKTFIDPTLELAKAIVAFSRSL
ncbi:aspartate/glutamate racemase family protein [Lonepinella sp. BR2357]|uniref:aspartate/glutamate racemase family protein n=1 Tax=Lonepinella sp. BR2357 TaxID=3434549 RepID=UPI003F6E4039